MIVLRSRILGLVAVASAAAAGAAACDTDLTDDPPPGQSTGGRGGSGGSGSGGTGQLAACQPTDAICYGGGDRTATSPGAECLANVDNTDAPRVQFRQTWNRSIKPVGNTENIVYNAFKDRTQILLPACYSGGSGGYIQLFDWDRSNSDVTAQTMRIGYANYYRTADDEAEIVRDGLCMLNWNYELNPRLSTHPLAEFNVPTDKWPQAKPQPWSVGPIVAKRVAEDFDLDTAKPNVPEGEAIFYANEETGWMHIYYPLGYVTLLDGPSSGIAVPIREAEQRLQFNDGSFNCLGRFRADVMDPNRNCDPGLDPSNPQWGCKDDAQCPPPNVVPAGHTDLKGPGTTPGFTRGYFLIVDLERVYSSTLGSTLCVSYPRESVSATTGWSGSWGKNCRGSSKWNPTAADDFGLPPGDWCSRTNSPATGTCHDAYLNESFSTAQAFKIKPDTCGLR